MMAALKAANLALAFVLELVAVGAFAYWGFTVSDSTALNVALAVGLAVVSIVLWGIFAAPKSARRLKDNALLVFKLVFFGLAALALILAGSEALGVVFGVLVALNLFLVYAWKQEIA